MKRILVLLCLFSSFNLSAQTGIGTTTPDASAKLEVSSVTKGLLPPRMTSTQRQAISSPATGLLVYQTDGISGFYVNTGTSSSPAWTKLNTEWNKSGNDISYSSGNVSITGNETVSGNVTATNFIGSGSQLTDVATKVTGSWNVPNGTNNFTIGLSPGTYIIWVNGNIPNGIITYNALVVITNTNVPVAGHYSSWVYTGGGTPLDFTSLPDQIVGFNTTARSSTYSGANSNNFIFGIKNTTSTTYQVNYGYIRL
jgi:hypothetical protein